MIQFDEKTHTYTVDGVVLPSVTHICRFLAYDYKSDKPWLAEAAARRGTAVHEACALIDYGEDPEETPEIAGYLRAYRRFLKDYRPDWELIEHPMGSLELGYAGTLDRYGTLYNGEPCIVDIKTGQLHKSSLRAQLSAYRILFIREHPEKYSSPHIYSLKLSKDGTYEFIAVQFDPELVKTCLFMNQAVERNKKRYE